MATLGLKSRALHEISVLIQPGTDDLAGAAWERLFGAPAAFYTNEETGRTILTIYEQGGKTSPGDLRRRAERAMVGLAAEGFPVQAGPVRVRRIKREDWANSWKKHFHPIEIEGRLLIKPSWSGRRPKSGQAEIVLDPGLSFGTGQHATTRFCLEQLARWRLSERRQSFLDIGTGSGILAISAVKLGYGPVRAFDYDPEAVRAARENAAANGVAGAVRPVRLDLAKLPLPAGRVYDIVCCNLIYDLLLAESRRITARVGPAGGLILSGILVQQFDAIVCAYESSGFRLERTSAEGEWKSGFFRVGGG